MNAVEKLEAAIAVLQRRREVSTPGPWGVDGDGLIYPDRLSVGDRLKDIGEFVRIEDAWLTETLHRTIDAQLAILRDDLKFIRERRAIGWPLAELQSWASREVLALADAILGDPA